MQDLLAFLELEGAAELAVTRAARILVILLLAWLLHAVASRLIALFHNYMEGRARDRDQASRIDTVERVFRYIATVIIAVVAGTLVLAELGLSVAPVLATAGVAGIAIGFGAQSLIRDCFNGIFLLVEDQIRRGEFVEIAGRTGRVEEVNLRHVRLRDFDGHVYFVPNSEIKVVVNRTREFAHAVMDAPLAARLDPQLAFAAMREVAEELRGDAHFGELILGDVEILGVEKWEPAWVWVRCKIRVVPQEQWNVRREFLRRLKAAFEARGLQNP
jgi:moderate conductance mechanosensitive channel